MTKNDLKNQHCWCVLRKLIFMWRCIRWWEIPTMFKSSMAGSPEESTSVMGGVWKYTIRKILLRKIKGSIFRWWCVVLDGLICAIYPDHQKNPTCPERQPVKQSKHFQHVYVFAKSIYWNMKVDCYYTMMHFTHAFKKKMFPMNVWHSSDFKKHLASAASRINQKEISMIWANLLPHATWCSRKANV